ncbi:MAG TPA: ATP-binding protein [Acetobacteraceae bacterium]|nr:ATP-binding protein [Acetobacteraceae bacterium]
MKRVANLLVAPRRLISRSVALLAAALLLIGTWGVAAYLQIAQVARDAFNTLTVSASAVAASIDVPIGQFADLTDAFRAADLQLDKVALTSRLLRLQSALPPVGATFAVSASGQLLAASSPFTAADAGVSDTDWFRRATADNAMSLALQQGGTWLRGGPSMVLTRVVRDPTGKAAGLVGAVLRSEDLGRLIGRAWFSPAISIELNGVGGVLALPGRDSMPPLPAAAEDTAEWGMRLMSAAKRLLDIPPQLSASAPLRTVDATVMASMDTDLALQGHGLDTRAIGVLGAFLGAVWLTCVVLAVSTRSSRARAGASPTGFGADWQVDLDRRGCIAAVHGYAPDRLHEAIGRPLPVALGLAGSDATPHAIVEALDARSRRDNIEVTIASGDGQDRVHRLSIDPLPDGRYACAGRDVTSEIRLAAKLDAESSAAQAAQAEAAAVTRDRDRVLAALGHDVRAPMNSIMGICSLLLDGELEQEQRLWLERIRASCDALLAMLNGLLEIASGEVGGTGLQVDEVDVIGLVQEVTDTLRPQAHDKGLDLKTRYDDLLRGHWLVDPTRLRQVLFNLVGNAIKFTASGHVEIRVSAVADSAGAMSIKLAVSDTGPGIAPEDRDHIFERFQRGRDQANAGHAGLGLGLTLCRENAALMGGALTVESALGVGSEFTFEFPAERVAQSIGSQRFAGRTALLVGDEDARTRTIASLLGDAGVMVESAPDGYLGLALAERIEAQRGALDLVIVQGALVGLAAEVFVLRLRDTVSGRRTVMIWLGDGGETAKVDAAVPAAADPYQVASLALQLLAQRSPLEVLQPMARIVRGGRILVVEDDKVNQSLLVAALSRRGFSAFVANDGDEAVRLAGHDSFDAILMDIQMPQRDGFEATQSIRAMSGRVATIPIIGLTGLKGPVMRKRCAEAGFTAVLEKPVNLDRLGATLRRWLPGGASGQTPHDPTSVTEPLGLLEDYDADVSKVFLEEMVAVVGMERARACTDEFVADATARCMRVGELLPGWEAGALVRTCEEIRGLAETCGATGLGEALEDIADAVNRNDRARAEALVARLEEVTSRLGPAMAACLDDIARRWKSGGSKAA